MPRRSLPRIEIAVPVPCRVDWNGMTRIDPAGLVRFCDSCDKPVYDSRSMTRAQLQATITRNEGNRPCMRLHVRPDGTVVTRDCFAPMLRLGRALWLKTSLLTVAFWGALLGLRSRPQRQQAEADLEPRETRVLQGYVGRREPAPPPDPERERLQQLPSPPPGPGEGPTPSGLGMFAWIDRAPPLRSLDAPRD
jgi:hypothetical protein